MATTNAWKRRPDWWFYGLLLLALLAVGTHALIAFGPGALRWAAYGFGMLLLSLLAVLLLVVALLHAAIRRPFLSKWRLIGFLGLLLIPVVYVTRLSHGGTLFGAYPSSHAGYVSPVLFRLPLDGPVAVGWGGDKEPINYHVIAPDQRWAYDLLVLRNGTTYAGDSSQVENYFCYGLPVLAPAAGRVVGVSDTAHNQPPGSVVEVQEAYGNYVALQVAPREYLFLCHLKPGSLRVRIGDTVMQGQPLAQVGNTGHTSEPHLHLHLQDHPTWELAEGIPLYFSNYQVDGRRIDRGMPAGGVTGNRFTGQVVQQL